MTETSQADLADRFVRRVLDSLDLHGHASALEIEMRPHSKKNRLILEELVADPPRQGHGTAALKEIVSVADAWGVEIEVELPDEITNEDDPDEDLPGLDTLVSWYGRFGFQMSEDGGVYYPHEPAPKPK